MFITLFTKFKPYREFIEQVRARGGLDSDLAYYLALPERAQKQQRTEWGDAEWREKIEKPLEDLAKLKTKDWPFFAVFQKGLFRATAFAWRHFAPATTDGSESEQFLSEWIDFLDKLHAEGLLEVHCPLDKGMSSGLWLGIALNPGAKTVKWNESSVGRISNTLLLWWYVYWNELRQAKRFIKAVVSKPKSAEKYPAARESIRELKKSLRSVVVGPEEDTPTEEAMDSRTNDRLAAIVDRVCRLSPAAGPVEAEEDEVEDRDEEDVADSPEVS